MEIVLPEYIYNEEFGLYWKGSELKHCMSESELKPSADETSQQYLDFMNGTLAEPLSGIFNPGYVRFESKMSTTPHLTEVLPLIDWMFPADRCSCPRSAAPDASVDQMSQLLVVPFFATKLYANFSWLRLVTGLLLADHSVELDRRKGERLSDWSGLQPGVQLAFARVLRSLYLAELKKGEFWDTPNRADPRYALWLQRTLCDQAWRVHGEAALDAIELWHMVLRD